MKGTAFWILSASTLFVLSLVYLHAGLHKKNPIFTYWLCAGVAAQVVAAWGLAAGRPWWFGPARSAADVISLALTAAVLIFAAIRCKSCMTNRALLMALGGMLALNIFGRIIGGGLTPPLRIWLRNIAFFGPAFYLLVVFSNIPLDRLPLWAGLPRSFSALRMTTEQAAGWARAFFV